MTYVFKFIFLFRVHFWQGRLLLDLDFDILSFLEDILFAVLVASTLIL